jgi:ABC-2 type transport system permease protein
VILLIARRELLAFFRLPLGWVVMAMYLFLSGLAFAYGSMAPGAPATLRDFFGLSGVLLVPAAPAVSMRLLSEEARVGTLETLLASPAGDGQIVLGKFLGACAFLGVVLAPTLAYPLALWLVSEPAPDAGPIVAGYIALVLLGAWYLALGTLASALTSNQTLAFLGTLLAIAGLMLVTGRMSESLPGRFGPLLRSMSPIARLGDFAAGTIDLAHVAWFIAWTGWLLVAAVVALGWRRWR